MEIDNKKVLISAIIVVLIVLVSYNFENLTGQAAATSNSRIITAPSSMSAGSSVTITVKPTSGVMNLGGSYQEQLWIKGPGYTTEISNYECVNGGTKTCKEAMGSVSISRNNIKGTYYITVEKTTYTGRETLAKKSIVVN